MNKEYQYRKEIFELREYLKKVDREKAFYEEKFNTIINSKSWKYTEFIRSITSKIKKSKKLEQDVEPVVEYDYHKEKAYDSHYEENFDFSKINPIIKTIAFYLPQFHSIPENDKWWGKNFTEWTNTKKSKPRFDGHYMPREPHEDFGYYTLDIIDIIKKQIELAKSHGIYGFAFYYYWFSGKRLLEKPVDLLLEHKEIDFPFVLCWANENWTRTWDGLEKNILIEQKYLDEDPQKFIDDWKKYTEDKRYIRIQNKPLLMVYNPKDIPDFEEVCKKWRNRAREIGIGEIEIWSKTIVHMKDYSNTPFVDGEFDFAPTQLSLPNDKITGINKEANVLNYSKIVESLRTIYKNHYPLKKFSYSVTMGWDNSARREKGYTVLYNYSLESFYKWTTMVMNKMFENDFSDTFLFVNAWNEWGEGTYLEPDKKYGYANINTLSKAICGIPMKANLKIMEQADQPKRKQNFKILVQAHVFYPDVLPEMLNELKKIPYKFDLFITTNTKEKKEEIAKILKDEKIKKYQIDTYPNHGRDILPMILQTKKVYQNYDYFLHLHTKKSTTTNFGNDWRRYVYKNILGNAKNILAIFNEFLDNPKLGIIYSIPYPRIFYSLNDSTGAIENNRENMEKLFQKLGIDLSEINYFLTFPTSSMFWAKMDAIKEIFTSITKEDFEEEDGQLDGTMAHAIERCFSVLAQKNGYTSLEIINRIKEQE